MNIGRLYLLYIYKNIFLDGQQYGYRYGRLVPHNIRARATQIGLSSPGSPLPPKFLLNLTSSIEILYF